MNYTTKLCLIHRPSGSALSFAPTQDSEDTGSDDTESSKERGKKTKNLGLFQTPASAVKPNHHFSMESMLIVDIKRDSSSSPPVRSYFSPTSCSHISNQICELVFRPHFLFL